MKRKNSSQVSIFQLLRQAVYSSRPISWINTAFPFVAGYLATHGVVNTYFFVVSLYFLIPYNFLIYIVNDVFDYESDVRNPRKNSIEGGLLPPETHTPMLVITGLVNLVPLMYIIMSSNTQINVVLLVIVLGALSYSVPPVRLKERPFFDSINSSFHFVSPLLIALLLTGGVSDYWPFVSAFFFWGCASHAFGAVQDIIADRKAGIGSIATFLGAKKTVRLSLGLYIATLVLLAFSGWPAIIVCLPVLLYVLMVTPYVSLSDRRAESANKGWRNFLLVNQLTGFVITMILIVARVY